MGDMKKKIRLSHYIEYVLIRCIEYAVNALPRGIYLRLGSLLGSAMYYTGIYRKVLKTNLDYVAIFDKKAESALTKNLYKNTVKVWMDFLRPATSLPPYVVHNMETLKTIMARNTGSIAVLAHIGNWELLARIFGTVVGDLNVLARPMKNPLVERWLLSKRKSGHVEQIYASGSLRKILTVLKRNGIVAMLIDQYAGDQGTSVPFLGKPANTVRSVAGIHYKTGCSIIFAYALLEKDNTYRVEIEEGPMLDALKMDRESFIAACQKAHNDVLSDLIRQYPDQYFGWFHRRFKDTISYS
jgi:KDO2-lipid IV(A) lauroyltransferase